MVTMCQPDTRCDACYPSCAADLHPEGRHDMLAANLPPHKPLQIGSSKTHGTADAHRDKRSVGDEAVERLP